MTSKFLSSESLQALESHIPTPRDTFHRGSRKIKEIKSVDLESRKCLKVIWEEKMTLKNLGEKLADRSLGKTIQKCELAVRH